jgi:hypothetical protein
MTASNTIAAIPILLATLVSACFYEGKSPLQGDIGVCEQDFTVDPSSLPKIPTYHQDIAPIAAAKCVECHRDGGIAPFALDTFSEFARRATSIRQAVAARIMPPWQPAPCCQNYRHDLSMSELQRAQMLAWLDGGTPEGESLPPPPRPEGGLPRVDATLQMSEPYSPVPDVGADELRCFLLDRKFDTETFITGLNVIPGNRQMVHHVVLFGVSESDVPSLMKKSGADGRPGWRCKSATNELPIDGVVGGWQPGDRARVFADGVGTRLKKGSRIVMSIHYDTGHGILPDQSSLQLMLADSVERIELGIPVQNPLWFAGDGMKISAGDPDASVFFAFDPTAIFTAGKAVDLTGVMLHMHEFGSSGRVAILRADGSNECLVNIPRWDFHWMTSYEFAQPVRLSPGDKLYLDCHWDNTASNQKMVNGEFPPPRDLGWGADEEMCAAIAFYTSAVQK